MSLIKSATEIHVNVEISICSFWISQHSSFWISRHKHISKRANPNWFWM